MNEINLTRLRKIYINKQYTLKNNFVDCVYKITKIKLNKQFHTSIIIDIKIEKFNYLTKGEYTIGKDEMSRKSKISARRYILPYITNNFKLLTDMVNENCWVNLDRIYWV
jgi:hypothetical protein